MLFQNHRINVLDKVWSRSLKLRKLSINCLLELSKNLKIKRGESLLASTRDKTDPLLTVHCWKNEEIFNPIQDGLFRGPKKLHPSVKSVTHILQWWNLAQIYLAQRRSKKYMNHVTDPLSSADISIFSPEISKSGYIKKYRYRLYFDP